MNKKRMGFISRVICITALCGCATISQAETTWEFSAMISNTDRPDLAQVGDVIEMTFSHDENSPNLHPNPNVVYYSDALYNIEVKINGLVVGTDSYSQTNFRVASEPIIGNDIVSWSAGTAGGFGITAFFRLPTFVIPFNPSPGDTLNSNFIPFAGAGNSWLSICFSSELDSCASAVPIQNYQFESPPPADFDSDGISDLTDNCTELANSAQRDTDGDGFGNLCDADLNNDCAVNFLDFSILSGLFLSDDEDADLNGDGTVNFIDISLLVPFFTMPPGPSGVASCP